MVFLSIRKNAYVSANKGFINAKLGTNFSDFEVVEEELDTDAYSKDCSKKKVLTIKVLKWVQTTKKEVKK
jgi:hypothetical protein